MPAFTGFPAQGVAFLRDLEDNNDRDWFKANRERYEANLAAPATALGEELGDLGRPKLHRMWRDTRFRPGPPLHERVAIGFWPEHGVGGYYVQLSLDGLMLAGGMHDPAPDQIERYRRAVDADSGALRDAIAHAGAAGLTFAAPSLKRAPRGFASDHPDLDLLLRKRFYVAVIHPLAAWLHRPEAGERIRRELEACTPLLEWLRAHVGRSQRR